MNYVDELKVLQNVTRTTQTELAALLGVSFPTLNSWLKGRSTPRQKAQETIHLLYTEHTGVAAVDESELVTKKERIEQLRKKHPKPLQEIIKRQDLYDTFVLELTYHTNSIEGSTLNEPEVRAVIFDGATIPDKSVVEHQEAKNHQAALGYLFGNIALAKPKITEEVIKKLHAILMNGILPTAGEYRDHSVRIAGSRVVTANHLKVETLMKKCVRDLSKPSANIYAHLAKTHAQFEQIHPFSDGNGRVGRLLLHYVAAQHNLPPVLIRQEKKQAYYPYLERAQTQGEGIFLEAFLVDAVLESYKLLT